MKNVLGSLTILLSSQLAPALAADVLVVDAAGGGDYTSVATAALAAADGDVLLVRPGNYPFEEVVIDGKGLTIVKDGPGIVKSYRWVRIQNLPAGKEVHLNGLSSPTSSWSLARDTSSSKRSGRSPSLGLARSTSPTATR